MGIKTCSSTKLRVSLGVFNVYCGNEGINYMLVNLGVLVAELVLMVRINERVVLQKCMGYLGKKFVWMFGGFG